MRPLESPRKTDNFWSLNHRDPMNGSKVMGENLYFGLAPGYEVTGEQNLQSGKKTKSGIILEPLNRF